MSVSNHALDRDKPSSWLIGKTVPMLCYIKFRPFTSKQNTLANECKLFRVELAGIATIL